MLSKHLPCSLPLKSLLLLGAQSCWHTRDICEKGLPKLLGAVSIRSQSARAPLTLLSSPGPEPVSKGHAGDVRGGGVRGPGWGAAAGGGEELSRTAGSPLARNLLAEVCVVCLCFCKLEEVHRLPWLFPASPQDTHTHTHTHTRTHTRTSPKAWRASDLGLRDFVLKPCDHTPSPPVLTLSVACVSVFLFFFFFLM